jgi:uncharacterized protein YkwD
MTPTAPPEPARHRTLRAAAAAILLTLAVIGSPNTAGADEYGDGHYSASLVNEARDWEGQPRLRWSEHLHHVAAAWAAELASGGYLAHNPNVWDQVDGWWSLGENVGYGSSIAEVHWTLWDSWSHWGNMVDPSYTRIGVGVAYDGWGGVYVVQVFAD